MQTYSFWKKSQRCTTESLWKVYLLLLKTNFFFHFELKCIKTATVKGYHWRLTGAGKPSFYYIVSFLRGQDEPNPVLWLATQVGKMELSSPLGTTLRVAQEKFPREPHNKSFIDQACSVKMAGYWRHSFFASLWTLTLSRSINRQKKNLANI